ncbi:MAG: transporter substrate-binding domain-containing protein [Clostridia bacterium]|nr:transporter substrate-binding domain-containing protein [Clostridia bacterium]
MKNIAKIICLLVALCICLTCAACGTKDTNSDAKADTVLDMATNAAFPPYEYKDDADGFAGIDIEIAELIADKLGMELKIHDVEFGSIVGGVESGKYDMGMAGMTITEDRLKSVNFSTSYANGIQSVIVPADSTYASFEDFYTGFDADGNPAGVKEGIKIGVQQDTTGDIYSSDTPAKWGFGEENVIRYKTGAEAVMALTTGKVTAVIIDNEPAKSFVASTDGLKILEGEYTNEDYAICVAKKNTELLNKINDALKELTDEGKIQAIIDKYIK